MYTAPQSSLSELFMYPRRSHGIGNKFEWQDVLKTLEEKEEEPKTATDDSQGTGSR
jgi:hypothetical protein